MTTSEPKIEYFVIRDSGYDGTTLDRFDNYDEAKKLYDFNIKHDSDLKKIYLNYVCNPIMLIKGQVLMEENYNE